ncbi:MAG: response regulator [Turneriella sp.]
MEKILIVEDEDSQRTVLLKLYRCVGLRSCVRARATPAIVYLSQNHADMALIDLHLSDNPGIEVLKHIRDTDGSIPMPVFMMSGEDSRGTHRLYVYRGRRFSAQTAQFCRHFDENTAGV